MTRDRASFDEDLVEGFRLDKRRLPIAGVFSLMLLGFSGYFKGSRVVDALFIDLTLLGVSSTGAFMLWRVLRGNLPARLFTVVPLVWGTFIPAAMYAATGPDADRKVLLLFSATLLCALGPTLVDERGLRVWIYGHIGAAAAMAALLWVNRNSETGRETLRLANDQVVTISSARVLGAGVLVLMLIGLHGRKWAVPNLALAIVGVVLMLWVGSRGPVLSFVLVLAILAGGARFSHWRMRMASLGLLAVVGYAFLSYLLTARNAAVQRIGGFITGDEQDSGRQYLYGVSGDVIAVNPLGLGWGGFAEITAFAYPHNLFLEVGAEAGWLAMIAVAAYCILCLERLRRVSTDLTGRIVFALALYWLLVAQTSNDINGNRMTWLALSFGLIAVIHRRRDDKVWLGHSAWKRGLQDPTRATERTGTTRQPQWEPHG